MSATPMDPSVRAWLGFMDVMPPLGGEEYLHLIANYREPEEVLRPATEANRLIGQANREARLRRMPDRDELLLWFATHSIKETMQYYKITLRCVYEWKNALGIVRAKRS